jgi:ABC-type glycerol-3-phosphate transport system substrate-binding protein
MSKILLCLLLVSACSEINKKAGLKDDNKLEEFIEEQIEEKTGIEVDFTPEIKDQS